MATIAQIPLIKIERIQLYINAQKKSLAAIKAETGADYALNGTLYDTTKWMPVMHFRADGKNYSSDKYNYNGFGWDEGPDIRCVESNSKGTVKNYICGVEMVHSGMSAQMYYGTDLAGARGRTAIALKSDSLILYCVGDGEAGRCTPEELRSEMLSLKADYAVMLDGGGSSQCDFAGKRVISSRPVQNLILVYLKKESPMKKPIVCLDPGHGGTDKSNGSPDGKYKEHIFALDMGKRISALLTEQGISVIMTRDRDASVTLTGRATIANNMKADLFVSLHSNAFGSDGWHDQEGLVVYTYAEGGVRDVLAKNILKRVKEAGVKTYGYELYHAKFAVLKYSNMPAALIEYGFHTTKADVARLQDSAYRDVLSIATAKGICDTLGIKWKETQKEPEKKKKYTITLATVDNKETANKVVELLKGIGVSATIKEEDE